MASPSSSVMLAVVEKKTNPVDLYVPLRQYLSQCYSERVASENEDDLQMVQSMRKDIQKSADPPEVRVDLLQRYFRALCVMEPRFPISSEKEHVNKISFTWFDAFKGKKASQQSIHFEKAAVMFNLGAVHSQLGLAVDRSYPNGIKQACSSFQAAAGAFAFLRDNIAMRASGNDGSTVDLSGECATMLERLMLAQAQECFFEKAIADKKAPSLCGKIARRVGLYYEETYAALTLPPLSQHFDRAWINHVQLKAAQFCAEACYRVALDLHENENISEEIARLKFAADTLVNAKKSAKGVVASLLDSVSKIESKVNVNLERAIKENDQVYLMRIPSLTSLGPLPSVSLVRSTNLGEALDASKEKMFTGLIPDSIAKALSRYTALLDDIIRKQVEKLQQESEITRVKLKELKLPESLHALEGLSMLPDDLHRDVESIKLDGGLKGLESGMRQLADLRRVNEELLVQAEDLLQKECQQDSQLRSQFGSRWKRPSSDSMTKALQVRLTSFAVKLKQAADVDARIDRLIKDNLAFMAILEVNPIESALPTLSSPIMSLNGDEDTIVADLKQSLRQLEILGSQRAQLEDGIKEMKQKDNILPKLLSISGSYDNLFKKELEKYDPLCLEVNGNMEAQDKMLQQITIQNIKFASVFNLEDHQAACDRVFKQLSAAVLKYWEIRDNIHNAGIKFYLSLQDAIGNLKQQCSDYVVEREKETRNEIQSLQRELAGFSFRDSRHSMQYPSVSGQPQIDINEVRPPLSHYNPQSYYPAPPIGTNYVYSQPSHSPFNNSVPATSIQGASQSHLQYQAPGSDQPPQR